MNFIIINNFVYNNNEDNVYLENSNWDDWFEFETVYRVYYLNKLIGNIKIGREGQTERRAILPSTFTCLPEGYFSLGTSSSYYAGLKDCNKRIEILSGLKDIA